MILFFDTETTGLVDFRRPPHHESQPHMVQLAALLCEGDGLERASINFVVDPVVPIPIEASNVHGITDDVVKYCAPSPSFAVVAMTFLARKADLVVGHNVDFDMTVILAAAHRAGRGVDGKILADKPTFCTMKTATSICKIPHANPRRPDDYKWPRLEECIRHFFDEELEGAHDALVDVRACKRVYFKLKEMEKTS